MAKNFKRDRAALSKVIKDLKKRGAKKRNGRRLIDRTIATRGMAENVLAQGVGQVPRNPFGSVPGLSLACLDAFNEQHASLPRAVGPYAVVRTTRIIPSDHKYMIFGTAMDDYENWTTTVAWGATSGQDNVPINSTDGVYTFKGGPPGGSLGDPSCLTCVPSAMSVQILNGAAVNEANGIIYGAVCPTQLAMIDNSRRWKDFEHQFTSFMRPRLMSGGKLALRGVQMNAYPLNMNALSNFQKIQDYPDGKKTWASGTGHDGNAQYLTGFTPMVVINTSGQELSYLVTVEYRVRFDISNPAVSSHRHHPVTSDASWEALIRKAVALGNGVRDIAEIVATVGQSVSAAHKALAVT